MNISLKLTDDMMDEATEDFEKTLASVTKIADNAFNAIMDYAQAQLEAGADKLSSATIYLMVLQAYQKEFKKLNPALLKSAIGTAETLMEFFDETIEAFKEEGTRYTA